MQTESATPAPAVAAPAQKRRARLRPTDARALKRLLKQTFGLDGWRAGQEQVIARVLAGADTLAVMPTGAGKSLCYQLPALLLDGTTLVVSPLIALMKDQVDKLDEAGIDAAQFNSAQSARDEAAAVASLRAAGREIVFATPERLADPDFLRLLRAQRVALLVVDEAHCISQWGHDFRLAFLEIGAAITALGEPTVLALTATATEAVADDIRRQLQRPGMKIVNTGVYRPNLHYRVIPLGRGDDKLTTAVQLVRDTEGAGIVYAATIKAADALYAALDAAGERVARYHGRLPHAERTRAQDAFMAGRARVMVATNAFGMGIDRADLRFIAHYQMPGSLEAYYQESGRAGRDGEAAACVLLYDPRDKHVQQFFLANRYPGVDELAAVHAGLRAAAKAGEPISVARLRTAIGRVALSKLRVALKLFRDAGLVSADRQRRYHLLDAAAEAPDFERLAADYVAKAGKDRDVLERMVAYAQTALCRWRVLLDYFDESVEWPQCGHCDNCARPLAPAASRDPAAIADHAPPPAAPPAFSVGDPVRVLKYGRGEVTEVGDDRVTVAFADGATRSFVQRYVKRLRR